MNRKRWPTRREQIVWAIQFVVAFTLLGFGYYAAVWLQAR